MNALVLGRADNAQVFRNTTCICFSVAAATNNSLAGSKRVHSIHVTLYRSNDLDNAT